MNKAPPLSSIEQVARTPWADFPDVMIHQSIPAVQGHPQYAAAKVGDVAAAQRLVDATLSADAVSNIAAVACGRPLILLPVHAQEAHGINRIPAVMAEALEALLPPLTAARVGTQIVQTNRAGHTGASGWARIGHPAIFDGAVESGVQYVIVDDFIGQGGTIANLKGYVESNGGRVIRAPLIAGGDADGCKFEPAG